MTREEFIKKGTEIFDAEVNRLALDNVSIKFVNIPKRIYARNVPSKDFNAFRVEINMYQFFKNKRNNEVNLYKNIIHELEHVKTLSYTKEPDYYNHDQIYSLMEYMSMVNKNSFYKDQVLKMNIKYRIQLGQLMMKNYQFSKSEIMANLESLKKLVANYKDALSEEDLKTYLFLIDIYTVLKDTAILRYDINNNTFNGVYITYGAVRYFIKKNPDILNNFQSLNNIFEKNGEYKNVYNLYQSINEDNKDLIENTIINFLLIDANINLTPYMNDAAFRDYLSDIIANYNNRVIAFYKNFNKINELFIKKNKKNPYLYYNCNILKKNVLVLARYLDYYNLEIKSGMIIDSSAIPNVMKKEKRFNDGRSIK